MPFVTKTLHVPTRQKTLSFLMQELGITRSDAQRLVSRGRISQNGVLLGDPYGYIEGDYEVVCFEPLSLGLEPFYVTNDFVIYDKPSGLRVHPRSCKSVHSLNDEIKHRFGNDANPTHRIDQETSGLVLVSRNKKSEAVLKSLFADRLISKRYLAMVKGHLEHPLDINQPLLRIDDPDLLVSMKVTISSEGKEARTLIKPLHYFPENDTTLVEAYPLTGRTHQIRAHLFHVKHPIIGDPVYGQEEPDIARYIRKELSREERLEKSGASRLLLHAHALTFEYDGTPYNIISEEDFITRCFESMSLQLRQI